MTDLKNLFTTAAGIMGTISGIILAVQTQGVTVPAWLNTTAVILGAISVGIIGFFSGKNADGTSKTESQLQGQEASK